MFTSGRRIGYRKHYIDWEDLGFKALMGLLITIIVALVAGIIVAIVLFIMNAVNAPSAGTIHAKDFEPAHTTTICHLVGKVTVCSPMYVPDSYEFDLYGKDHKHGWVDVPAAAYQSHKVGDYYDTKG